MKKQIKIGFEPEMIEIIDRVAKESYRNRTQFVTDCVYKELILSDLAKEENGTS